MHDLFQVVQGRVLADGKALDYRVNGNKTVVDCMEYLHNSSSSQSLVIIVSGVPKCGVKSANSFTFCNSHSSGVAVMRFHFIACFRVVGIVAQFGFLRSLY